MEQNQNKGPKDDGPKNKQSLLVVVICLMMGLIVVNLFSILIRPIKLTTASSLKR